MAKIEEALVWLGQCKTQAGKALAKEFKGSTAAFMKENLKSKASELLSMQSKMEGYKIFGAADFQEVKTQLASVGKCLLVLVYLDKSLSFSLLALFLFLVFFRFLSFFVSGPFSLLVLFCFWSFFGSCPFLFFAFNLLLIWIISICDEAAWSARRSSVD